jgi:hypothetical protein
MTPQEAQAKRRQMLERLLALEIAADPKTGADLEQATRAVAGMQLPALVKWLEEYGHDASYALNVSHQEIPRHAPSICDGLTRCSKCGNPILGREIDGMHANCVEDGSVELHRCRQLDGDAIDNDMLRD